ncbi:hypothetical protein OAN307_c31810 [Octadecabacter antarcticus 307]|uniref:Uncharacterized protein n=1 Tax=Octadecabacter antarcticus 307 TaxID=391626 RepID=M9RFV6_9RHOB|nr:hypothetical protein [Octadecabacter antarcticus]AGI68710.1 hypothetical protein OAN307_c31810 [Octadecabacter antarcticus 307]
MKLSLCPTIVIPELQTKDNSTGGLLAFIVAAPVVAICCAGRATLIGTSLFGSAGFLLGANLLIITLMVTLGSILILATRNFIRVRRHNQLFKEDQKSERQTS